MPNISEPSADLDALRLCLIRGVGPRLRQELLSHFGSATQVLQAALSDLRQVPGIGPKLAQTIVGAQHSHEAEAEIDYCRRQGIQILLSEAADYPAALQEVYDPPGVLFVRGQILPQDRLSIAVVGSRHATHYGLTQAERLSAGLARAGFTINSGLARGIDAAAHRGALSAGGRTLAVLGSGVDQIYPPEHQQLARDVASQGALISESPPRTPPLRGAFPQRNRVISGLSLGVLVIEAAKNSGALITARHAMEQSREVFAVPGRIDSRLSEGCHALIRDGAKLVQSIDDILEELGPLSLPTVDEVGQAIHHPAELQLNEVERQVLTQITSDPQLIDQIIASSQLPAANVLATLSILEMRRLIRRTGGNRVSRIS